MPNETDTVGKLFDCSIELERAAEALYNHFADLFGQYPEVALFWKHYANEERGHAAYLERIQASMDGGRLSGPADAATLQKARHCLDQFLQARQKPIHTFEDAHQLATELENSETNAIFEFIIVNFSTGELAKSHQFLRVQLSTHIAGLEAHLPQPYKSRLARQHVFAAGGRPAA